MKKYDVKFIGHDGAILGHEEFQAETYHSLFAELSLYNMPYGTWRVEIEET